MPYIRNAFHAKCSPCVMSFIRNFFVGLRLRASRVHYTSWDDDLPPQHISLFIWFVAYKPWLRFPVNVCAVIAQVIRCFRAWKAVIQQRLCETYGRKELEVTSSANPPPRKDLERLFKPVTNAKTGDGGKGMNGHINENSI